MHGMCDVGDSRSLVAADHLDAALCAIFQHLHHDLSAFRVKDDVAGKLRDGRGDEGKLAGLEAHPLGEGPPDLARRHDVQVRLDGHRRLPRDRSGHISGQACTLSGHGPVMLIASHDG